MYTDSHAHITCDDLYTRIDEVIQNMNELSHCMIMCTNIEEFKRALKLKKRDSRFKVAFGWFPGDTKEIDSSKLEQLKDIAFAGQIDCLGEIGLDYYWDTSFNDLQKELFIRQIEIANATKLPISIHMRESTKDCLDILRQYAKTKIIFHCFSGTKETMNECLKMDSLISFAGPLTFKNARHAPECVQTCPLDRLLTETDSPYLTPVPHRGKQNEPMYVKYVAQKVAEIKGLFEKEVCTQIEKNFLSLF
ncbi:MAG: TatD family hydrolase [Faecalicoccus sp.]|uniref:TatD family hydrolase n=1 Tax=Faecalicoccus sp. TaxID=1971758 RepID=UPI002A83999C|nr:TatD family hydrolase [Faecalicoccus sp.]MDY4870071.1 TatD family hydrolase [Faecalicoccus sp.]